MTRNASSAVQAAIAADRVCPILMFEGQMVSDWVRVWSGIGPLVWSGNTFLGCGTLVGVGSVAENSGLKATGVVVSLAGIPNDYIREVISETQHRYKGTLWFAFADGSSGQIIADPVEIYRGNCDVVVIKRDEKESTVQITYETPLIDKRPRERRYTQEDQQIDFPGDTGFKYVAELQNKDLSAKGNAVNSSSGSVKLPYTPERPL